MPLDVEQLLKDAGERAASQQTAHINPRFAKAMGLIGFDKAYVRAEGAHLWDADGNRYLDTLAGYGVFNMGRNHPTVRQALSDFLASGASSLAQLETPLLSGALAEQLKRRAPKGFDYVCFTNSGTEGVETAIKFAHRATKKPAILYASSAFHGLTNGALALNGTEMFRKDFGPLSPDCRKVPFNDLEALEAFLAAGDVAAFIVEPIQGKGVNIPDAGYLREAAKLCHAHGALFIADEIQTGLYRTGKFLAIEHDGGNDGDVDADMVILSKSLSGGYVPVGALLYKQDVYDKVFSSLEECVVHSSTFAQGNFAMVAGLAALLALDEEDAGARAERMGNKIGQGLLAIKDRFEFIGDVRWRGLMIGIEFQKPESLKLRTAWKTAHMMNADLFCQAVTVPLLAEHKILSQVSGYHMDIIKLIPPLVMSDEDADWFLESFEAVMVELHKFPGAMWDTLFRIGKNAL